MVINQLQDFLPQIDTLYLGYDEARDMSQAQRLALKAVFPNIKNVILLDWTLQETINPLAESMARELGHITPISLLYQCMFRAKSNLIKQKIDEANINPELKEQINAIILPR